MKRFGGIKVKYYGHAAFRFISPKNKVIFIDPWISNPKSPGKDYNKVDLILITHGHGDHLGDTIEIANKTNALCLSIYEISVYLNSKGVKNVQGMNKGGTFNFNDIKITMTDATHSSGIEEGGRIISGGEPCGFIINFENGFKIYHMGDTGLFGGIDFIGKLYKPDLVLIPIGSLFTMGPEEAAFAINILKPKYAIPMHFGTFPPLTGTPQEFLERVKNYDVKTEIIILNPGEEIE